MKTELRQQARQLANELDWLQVQTPVANRLKNPEDSQAVNEAIKVLYRLSENTRREKIGAKDIKKVFYEPHHIKKIKAEGTRR